VVLPAVLQDDLLYATLTVHETLYFAAMLRLPKHKSKAEKVGWAAWRAGLALGCPGAGEHCWPWIAAWLPQGSPSACAASFAGPHLHRLIPAVSPSCLLCLPAFAQLARVDSVIESLGLQRCRDTIIGDHLRRGVSGEWHASKCCCIFGGHTCTLVVTELLWPWGCSKLDSWPGVPSVYNLKGPFRSCLAPLLQAVSASV
jgi:hypothetical protein